MKDYGVSRKDRFQNEMPVLRELPADSFNIRKEKRAKVHPDCCIQLEKCFYSVPFQYCGQTLLVRYCSKAVEVFNTEGQSIAFHGRLTRIGQSSINESHLPDYKIQNSSFEIKSSLQIAAAIGPKTLTFVKEQFDGSHPLRRLRRVQGLLRLKKEFPPESLEYACSQAMTFKQYRLSYLKDCAKHWIANGSKLQPVSAPKRDTKTTHLHG